MSNDFSNNPFASLQNKLKPKNTKTATKLKSASPPFKSQPKPIEPVGSSQHLDDAELFFQAVHSTTPSKKQNNRLTQLDEHESFAKLSEDKQKKSKQSKKALPHVAAKVTTQTALTPALNDEQEFFKAMQEVAPLTGKGGRDVMPEVEQANPACDPKNSYESLLESNVEFALALKGEYLEGHVLGLDEDTMNGLRSGRYSPEAHLDLHGLNAMQAYQALVNFFRASWYKGLRNVLIVPGRGKNSLNGYGVLRDKLQTWLTQEPFKRVVLAFCTARPVDGGPGSVYVLLRKYKKKGKIQWERLPSDPDLF